MRIFSGPEKQHSYIKKRVYIHFAPCNEKTKPNKQTEELNAFQFSFLLFIVLLFFLTSGQVILDMLSESDLERHFQPRISIAGI